MGLEQSEVIDLITESPDGAINLVIAETGPWVGSPERLEQLQSKLNMYIHFIESGQLAEQYPDLEARQLVIQLDTLEEPDDVAREAFARAEQTLQASGIRFVVERYPDELVEAVRAQSEEKRALRSLFRR